MRRTPSGTGVRATLGGYAGLTLMPPDAAVLTIEFKINLLAPAKGQRFRCEGRVLKPGRTIVLAEGRAFDAVEPALAYAALDPRLRRAGRS